MTAKSLRQRIQHEAYTLVLWQLFWVAMLALLAFPLTGAKGALAVLAGGMAYGLPNLLFVWRVFRYTGAKQMTQFVTAFLLGETVKLIVSAILFLMIVKYLSLSLLSTLVGFVGAIVSCWVVCLCHFSKQQQWNRKEWKDA